MIVSGLRHGAMPAGAIQYPVGMEMTQLANLGHPAMHPSPPYSNW